MMTRLTQIFVLPFATASLDGTNHVFLSRWWLAASTSNNDYLGAGIIGNDYMQQLGYASMDLSSYFSSPSPVTYPSLIPMPNENVGIASPSQLMNYYRWSFPYDDSIKDILLAQPYKPTIKDVRRCVNGARLAQRNSTSVTTVSHGTPRTSNKRKVIQQIVGNARKVKTKAPVKRSHKVSDKISALQELVSPYGKTDTASVLQEACIYIKIIHQEIRRLSLSYFELRPLLTQLQGDAERPSDLQSRGLCLVPLSILKTITNESLGEHHTVSRTFRRP